MCSHAHLSNEKHKRFKELGVSMCSYEQVSNMIMIPLLYH